MYNLTSFKIIKEILKRLFLIFNFKFIQTGFLIIISLLFIPQAYVFGGNHPNNKFGIHLAQPHLEDLPKVAEMVNGGGGDWGYVTLVIQENDKNREKWQEIFNQLRELHLIPIIRIATSPQGEKWRRPSSEDVKNWVNFLDSLNWVIKNRYVVLFNEPNHGKEWGGEVDPKSYAEIAFSLAKALEEKNSDFFVMLAGFDASAPHEPPLFWDEERFLKEIFNNSTIDQFNNFISGWVSHSYPNPNFSGSPLDTGRGTIRTYQWEIDFLRDLGINKNLPVFVTETGWERKKLTTKKFSDEETIGYYYKNAFENAWLTDERVWAVTPFIFDYQTDPFLGFSFKKQNSSEFYYQYYVLKNISKVSGRPLQVEKGAISFSLPKKLVAGSSYNFKITLKNKGQAIWERENYQLDLENVSVGWGTDKLLEVIFNNLPKIRPKEKVDLDFFLKINTTSLQRSGKDVTFRFILKKGDEKILKSSNWSFKIIPPPSLRFEVAIFPRVKIQNYDNYEIQIFDKNENLVYKRKGIRVKNKIGRLDSIENVILGERYRVVVLRPYYLPRQNFITFSEKENFLRFKTMLPLDFNLDGKFDLNDILGIFNLRIK